MCWGDLSRHDQLQAGEQRIGDPILPFQPRVLQHENAAFGFLGGNQVG
jgi:hypothetical protein